LPGGPLKLDIASNFPIAMALNVGVIDQVLHALWRGGYFDLVLQPGDLNGAIPAGVSLESNALLPPTAELTTNGRLRVSLGAMRTTLTHPLLANPVPLTIGGRISCIPVLVEASEDLSLDDCNVEELHLSRDGELLAPQIQLALEALLSKVINDALIAALNSALPTVPIPALQIPDSAGSLGLPVGAELGILDPQIRTLNNHLILEGNFGMQ